MLVDNLMITSDSQQFTLQLEHLSASETVRETQGQTCCHLLQKYCLLSFWGCVSLFVLKCQQIFKCEFVVLFGLRNKGKKKEICRDFMLLLHASTWGNDVTKTPAPTSTAEIEKINTRHMWQHKEITKLNHLFCYFLFLPFVSFGFCAHEHNLKRRTTARRLTLAHKSCVTSDLAKRHGTLAIAHRDAAGRCSVRGFTGWQKSHQRRGGNMTGTLASRCRLRDNAALINFLFFCHNDRRQWSHDKMESWIKKKIGRGWHCQEELWAALLIYNFCRTT